MVFITNSIKNLISYSVVIPSRCFIIACKLIFTRGFKTNVLYFAVKFFSFKKLVFMNKNGIFFVLFYYILYP